MEIGHWPMIRTASLSMHVPSSHWNRTRISRYAPTSMLSQRDIGGTGRALSNCVFLRRLRVRRKKHCRTRPENQETTARHHQNHPAWILQLQARGVRQQDQSHHPHGLRLPACHQPHQPDHAQMRRTRHPATGTSQLTHENSRSL